MRNEKEELRRTAGSRGGFEGADEAVFIADYGGVFVFAKEISSAGVGEAGTAVGDFNWHTLSGSKPLSVRCRVFEQSASGFDKGYKSVSYPSV